MRADSLNRLVIHGCSAGIRPKPFDELFDFAITALDSYPTQFWEALRARLNSGPARLVDQLRVEHRTGFGEALSVDAVLEWVGDNPRRGEAIASLLGMIGPGLPPLARALIVRFGEQSTVAQSVTKSVMLARGAARSLDAIIESRIARAEKWAADPHPAVKAWVASVNTLSRGERIAAKPTGT